MKENEGKIKYFINIKNIEKSKISKSFIQKYNFNLKK